MKENNGLNFNWLENFRPPPLQPDPHIIKCFPEYFCYILYPTTQKVAGYYVIPSELWVSVRLYVYPSASASFPCSNFSTFWPIFFKLCIDIGIGEEWYGIASGLISFWNNRVMALDVCQKCFALRFRALTLVPFYRFSSDFAQTLVSERSGMGLQVG